MSSVNKVLLVGNVGKDPEIRVMQSNDKVASFSIATSESWKDKATGERKEKTEWHRISVFNQGIVSVIERFVRKGTKIFIEGQLETRKWTDSHGVEKYSTEIILRPFRGEMVLLGGKEQSEGDYQENQASGGKTPSESVEVLEDEIPF